MYFDAHLHLFDDTPLGNTLAANIGERPDRDYYFSQYLAPDGAVGGVVMGNGPLDAQGKDLPERFYYTLGLDEPSLFPLREETYSAIRRRLEDPKCVGVKLYPGYIPLYPDDPQYEGVIRCCEQANKVLAVHTGMTADKGAKMKYARPMRLDDIAVDHPELKIVMCHFGNPFLEEAAAVMEHNRNVYADLSGLIEGPFAPEHWLEKEKDYLQFLRSWLHYVGDGRRFLFGTDWPAVNGYAYAEFISRIVDPDWLDGVMLHNACAVYNIPLN